MELEIAKALAELMESHGIDVDLRETYSGRFMYGETTAGLVIPRVVDLIQFVWNNMAELVEMNLPDMSELRSDNMARSMIVY